MESLTWFGSYSATFSLPISASLAGLVVLFLTSGLIGFASGNGQVALLRTGFVTMTFLFVSFFILIYLFLSGGADVNYNAVIRGLLMFAAVLVAFGLFAALTSWILRASVDDAPGVEPAWRLLHIYGDTYVESFVKRETRKEVLRSKFGGSELFGTNLKLRT